LTSSTFNSGNLFGKKDSELEVGSRYCSNYGPPLEDASKSSQCDVVPVALAPPIQSPKVQELTTNTDSEVTKPNLSIQAAFTGNLIATIDDKTIKKHSSLLSVYVLVSSFLRRPLLSFDLLREIETNSGSESDTNSTVTTQTLSYQKIEIKTAIQEVLKLQCDQCQCAKCSDSVRSQAVSFNKDNVTISKSKFLLVEKPRRVNTDCNSILQFPKYTLRKKHIAVEDEWISWLLSKLEEEESINLFDSILFLYSLKLICVEVQEGLRIQEVPWLRRARQKGNFNLVQDEIPISKNVSNTTVFRMILDFLTRKDEEGDMFRFAFLSEVVKQALRLEVVSIDSDLEAIPKIPLSHDEKNLQTIEIIPDDMTPKKFLTKVLEPWLLETIVIAAACKIQTEHFRRRLKIWDYPEAQPMRKLFKHWIYLIGLGECDYYVGGCNL